jgi:hypothetical protein
MFRRKRPTLDHPFFGRVTFMPGRYWEAELTAPAVKEKVGVTIPADETGPSPQQVAFCRTLLEDLDGLFERCRPVFVGRFEEWTEKPFPRDWREDFSLVGLGLPVDGDPAQPWDVTYFVDAANHYFTAYFENGTPADMTIDG